MNCWVPMRSPLFSMVLKPCMVTLTVYGPGSTWTNAYSPAAFVMALRVVPFASLISVTLTPGTTPPDSRTAPRKPP